MLDELRKLIGIETSLERVARGLRHMVRLLKPPLVGAMHITCADESEWECIDVFQRQFVEELLPPLKHAQRAPFRLCNLGARYEEGALPVAEHHYATPETREAFKVMVIKVNGHVAVTGVGEAAQFGTMQRYDAESKACGALHALMDGKELPALAELRAMFAEGGMDRLGALLDGQRVDPARRSLYVALVSAQLQARRVADAVADHPAHSPTVYLIASCMTFNRPGEDTELLCGVQVIDQRPSGDADVRIGLGDDPMKYRFAGAGRQVRVTDEQWAG